MANKAKTKKHCERWKIRNNGLYLVMWVEDEEESRRLLEKVVEEYIKTGEMIVFQWTK